MQNFTPDQVPGFITDAIADAKARYIAWAADNGTKRPRAEHTFLAAQVRTFPRTWPTTAGMVGGVGGRAMLTSQVTGIYVGGDVPAYMYENGEYRYSLDVTGDPIAADWWATNTPPSAHDGGRLGHITIDEPDGP